MTIDISPKTIYTILRVTAQCLGVWPLTVKRGFFNIDYIFWFCLLNHMLVLLFSMYGLYVNRSNIVAASYSWIEVGGFIEVVAVLIFSKYKKSCLQVCEIRPINERMQFQTMHYLIPILFLQNLFHLAEEQLKFRRKPKIMQQYANVYVIMYLILMAFYCLAVIIYFFLDKPTTGHQQLLLSVVYPFRIESPLLKALIYSHHVIALTHTSIVTNYDGINIFLIYMCIYRLKVLECHFRNAKYCVDLASCIQEHNNILQ